LKDTNGKSYHGRQYKNALAMHNKQRQGGIRENTENREIEETKKNKGDKQKKLRVSKEIRVIGVKNMYQ